MILPPLVFPGSTNPATAAVLALSDLLVLCEDTIDDRGLQAFTEELEVKITNQFGHKVH